MLKEKLQNDLNAALKEKDQLKRLVLGMVMTAVKNKELMKRQQLSKTVTTETQNELETRKKLEQQSQLTDEEMIEVIAGEVKKRKEAIEQFKVGGRDELAQKEKSEMDILLTYLPEQMSDDEIRSEVQKTISEVGATSVKDMGKVIGAVMTKLKGRADGGTVSKIVKELLGSG